MGKCKKMNKEYNKDIMVCPNCKGLFVNRKYRRCPFCNMRLIYPGEGFSSETDAFVWLGGKWKRVCDLKLG